MIGDPFHDEIRRSCRLSCAEETGNILDKMDGAEAASVLKRLKDWHPELRAAAETVARGVLSGFSMFAVAHDVQGAVPQFDYEDLNSPDEAERAEFRLGLYGDIFPD